MPGQCRHQFLLVLAFLLFPLGVGASIPEGLEGLVLRKGKAQSQRAYLGLQVTESLWRSEGPSANIVVDLSTKDRNSFTLGYQQTTARPDKIAYFLRFDYIMGSTQSLSLKWLHNDWGYIPAAQENLALEYNGFMRIESLGTGAFYSIGLYQRWLKQSWNDDYQNPLSLRTDDSSAFGVATLGLLFDIGKNGSFATVDINNRNPLNYFNSDDIGTDLSFYWALESGRFIRLLAGTRWSGFFTFLPGFATTSYVGAGITW